MQEGKQGDPSQRVSGASNLVDHLTSSAEAFTAKYARQLSILKQIGDAWRGLAVFGVISGIAITLIAILGGHLYRNPVQWISAGLSFLPYLTISIFRFKAPSAKEDLLEVVDSLNSMRLWGSATAAMVLQIASIVLLSLSALLYYRRFNPESIALLAPALINLFSCVIAWRSIISLIELKIIVNSTLAIRLNVEILGLVSKQSDLLSGIITHLSDESLERSKLKRE